jgi:hypothetical protein
VIAAMILLIELAGVEVLGITGLKSLPEMGEYVDGNLFGNRFQELN